MGRLLHDEDGEIERPYGMTDSAMRLGRGPEVLAGAVGLQQVLNAERASLADSGSLAPDGGVQDGGLVPDEHLALHRCLLDPANYDIWAQPADGGWHVVIWPSGPCNGDRYGGGGKFDIDGQSFEVINGELFE